MNSLGQATEEILSFYPCNRENRISTTYVCCSEANTKGAYYDLLIGRILREILTKRGHPFEEVLFSPLVPSQSLLNIKFNN